MALNLASTDNNLKYKIQGFVKGTLAKIPHPPVSFFLTVLLQAIQQRNKYIHFGFESLIALRIFLLTGVSGSH